MASPPSRNPPGIYIAGDHDQLAIVFVRARDDAERLAAQFSGSAYHAAMATMDKRKAGIDLPNVSLVVHLDFPFDLITYYQGAGRAGRDGGPAEAVMIYNTARVPAEFRGLVDAPCTRNYLLDYFDGRIPRLPCKKTFWQVNCGACAHDHPGTVAGSLVTSPSLPHGAILSPRQTHPLFPQSTSGTRQQASPASPASPFAMMGTTASVMSSGIRVRSARPEGYSIPRPPPATHSRPAQDTPTRQRPAAPAAAHQTPTRHPPASASAAAQESPGAGLLPAFAATSISTPARGITSVAPMTPAHARLQQESGANQALVNQSPNLARLQQL
ncbi:RecQ family ATP-dependent DNA helicase [Colletotrichum gloeosporioides Cg-14]|uniref:DNA 3'-5' helicase n=1 Tax=Colletotrichum gloeosporioides (strain Cg-14) TaxID=1237896 RepID=T0M4M1_COLGC|nr:RecQ family ATP-dependent DNA helicase [Colletotrichum gloeosporioides Cg-14]